MRIIADFEGRRAPFNAGRLTRENVPGGGTQGLVVGDESRYASIEAGGNPLDWSGYGYLRFDAYNPSDQPVRMGIEIRDVETDGYWTRVNHNSLVPPGESTLSFRTDFYVGEKSRPGRPLLLDQITRFVLIFDQPVTINNVRLETLDTSAAEFEGLIAIDFGPTARQRGSGETPLMEGFQRGNEELIYDAERGFGFERGATMAGGQDSFQPDALMQDFIRVPRGTFRADLPNGTYRVWLNLNMAGGYWGEVQSWDRRQVRANGRTVLDQSMDFDAFLARYYRNADREDLPGIDTFAAYVEPMFEPLSFDVEVSDGVLRIELDGHGSAWANCLTALVIFPHEKLEEGERFLQWVSERRRAHFEEYFKQVEPARAQPPASGNLVFHRPFVQSVNAFDGPAQAEVLDDGQVIFVTVARGEEIPVTFAIQPSADELGRIDIEIGPFTSDAGATLDPATFKPGWLDYRISRIAMDGSSYTVAPRYWHPTPAPAALGVTRRFWLRTRPAAETDPGTYTGTITIRPEMGQTRSIQLSVRVLPFELDPITDVAIGPWGSSINTPWHGPQRHDWNWTMFEKTLDVLREAGATTFTGRPSLRITARDGQITLHTEAADREMALIREKGFSHMIGSYGMGRHNMGYDMYGTAEGPDVAAARRAGFDSMEDFLRALYGALDAHAVENDWLPVLWNLYDEPVGARVPATTENVKLHARIAQELNLQRTFFMGAGSLHLRPQYEGDISNSSYYEMIVSTPVASLNIHDEAAIAAIRERGNEFSFYNGGNRWTYGRYARFLVVRHGMPFRVTWHYNIVAADPYYALDAREDDYTWFNTNARQELIPSTRFLAEIQPGLNDYRYLVTLERLVRENPGTPAAEAGQALLDQQLALEAGAHRDPANVPMPGAEAISPAQRRIRIFESDRAAIIEAIERFPH